MWVWLDKMVNGAQPQQPLPIKGLSDSSSSFPTGMSVGLPFPSNTLLARRDAWLPRAVELTSANTLQPWLSDRPLWRNWDDASKAITEGFKADHWVYICVRELMKAQSSVPWLVEEQGDDYEWVKVPERAGHPMHRLTTEPNEHMSMQDLMERTVSNLSLTGNSVWSHVVDDYTGEILELWPMQLDGVRPVPDQREFLLYYEFQYGSVGPWRLEPHKVTHMMMCDPGNLYWGMGPLQAAAKLVDTHVEAVRWNKVALQNRCVTDGVFSLPGPITDQQYDAVKSKIAAQHMGASGARVPWLLSNGAQWNQMALTPVEMDFLAGLNMTRQEICAVFGIMPIVVGIMENSSYNNIDTARRIVWEQTHIPMLNDMQIAMNMSFFNRRHKRPIFGDRKYRVRYDTSGVAVLQEMYGEQIERATKLCALGFPLNEVNDKLRLGFKPQPWGNKGMLPSGLVPAEEAVKGMEARVEEASQTTEIQSQHAERQAAFMQSIAPPPGPNDTAKKSFDPLDPEERKALLWQKVHDDQEVWVDRVAGQIGPLFEAEFALIGKALTFKDMDVFKGRLDDILTVNEVEWTKWLTKMWHMLVIEFGGKQIRALGGAVERKSKRRFDPYSESIAEFIRWEVVLNRIRGIKSYTAQRILTEVAAGIEEGEGMMQIAKRLMAVEETFVKRRAVTIARTEVHGATSFAAYEAALQSEIVEAKTWISARDVRVRDSHKPGTGVDGETVGIHEYFSNGLAFPGDPHGPAREIINCRCALKYLLTMPRRSH